MPDVSNTAIRTFHAVQIFFTSKMCLNYNGHLIRYPCTMTKSVCGLCELVLWVVTGGGGGCGGGAGAGGGHKLGNRGQQGSAGPRPKAFAACLNDNNRKNKHVQHTHKRSFDCHLCPECQPYLMTVRLITIRLPAALVMTPPSECCISDI